MQSKGLERVMFFAAAILLSVVILETTALTLASRSVGIALWRELLVEIPIGREAGFPIALEGGVPPLLLAQVSFTQDIGLFCVLYPVFLRLMHRHRTSTSWLAEAPFNCVSSVTMAAPLSREMNRSGVISWSVKKKFFSA